jgi:hypothetical protein
MHKQPTSSPSPSTPSTPPAGSRPWTTNLWLACLWVILCLVVGTAAGLAMCGMPRCGGPSRQPSDPDPEPAGCSGGGEKECVDQPVPQDSPPVGAPSAPAMDTP